VPVILPSFQDPFDVLLQGEQFRNYAIMMPVGSTYPMLDDPSEDLPLAPNMLIAGEQNLFAMIGSYPTPNVEVLRSHFTGNMIAANCGVMSQTGNYALVFGNPTRINPFVQNTARFQLTGTTYDYNSAALASCRVVVLETSRINVGGSPVVAETTSDGSGNYSIEVPSNTSFQIIAYKAGSPDVAGVTRSDVVPTQI
jgi:hypothetical protein